MSRIDLRSRLDRGRGGGRPASAAPGVQRIAAQSSTDSGATKTVAAYCPPGTVPLGGGFASPARPSDVKIRATGVHLTDTSSYYAITGDVASDPSRVGPWTLYATAVCAPQPAGYEIRVGYSPFSPGGFKGVTTSCSPGKKALSVGGYVYASGGGAVPQLTLNGFALTRRLRRQPERADLALRLLRQLARRGRPGLRQPAARLHAGAAHDAGPRQHHRPSLARGRQRRLPGRHQLDRPGRRGRQPRPARPADLRQPLPEQLLRPRRGGH